VEPISVGLKFGFLAVLYLFLLWVARSALRDLRDRKGGEAKVVPRDATAVHGQPALGGAVEDLDPRLRVERGPGLNKGDEYELDDDIILGRSDKAAIKLEDAFSSARHARLSRQGSLIVLEDLGSTNGTYLNGEPISGPQPMHPGDRIRIGDTEFSYLQ
jgi:hypothetical protein